MLSPQVLSNLITEVNGDAHSAAHSGILVLFHFKRYLLNSYHCHTPEKSVQQLVFMGFKDRPYPGLELSDHANVDYRISFLSHIESHGFLFKIQSVNQILVLLAWYTERSSAVNRILPLLLLRMCERSLPFLSPPALMHGGLLGVAFYLSVCPSICLSVCLSVCD